MNRIRKMRGEWFGGIIFSENPASVVYVNEAYSDALGIPKALSLTHGLYSAPLDVHISITERCHTHCLECYKARDGTSQMSFLDARVIIQRLSALGVFTIALGGGEPFIHPDLFKIAEFARSVQIVPNVTTRGDQITDEIACQCAVFGNIHLSCNHSDDLSRLTAIVCRLRKYHIQPGINFLATAASIRDLHKVFAWCERENIARILILRYKTTGANAQNRERFSLTCEQERYLFPEICRLARRYSVVPMIDCSLFPAVAIHGPKKRDLQYWDVNGCLGGNAFLAITSDGRFKPCSFWPETFGHVLELTHETWQSNAGLNAFRNTARTACGNCSHVEACRGGCRLDSETLCARHETWHTPQKDRI